MEWWHQDDYFCPQRSFRTLESQIPRAGKSFYILSSDTVFYSKFALARCRQLALEEIFFLESAASTSAQNLNSLNHSLWLTQYCGIINFLLFPPLHCKVLKSSKVIICCKTFHIIHYPSVTDRWSCRGAERAKGPAFLFVRGPFCHLLSAPTLNVFFNFKDITSMTLSVTLTAAEPQWATPGSIPGGGLWQYQEGSQYLSWNLQCHLHYFPGLEFLESPTEKPGPLVGKVCYSGQEVHDPIHMKVAYLALFILIQDQKKLSVAKTEVLQYTIKEQDCTCFPRSSSKPARNCCTSLGTKTWHLSLRSAHTSFSTLWSLMKWCRVHRKPGAGHRHGGALYNHSRLNPHAEQLH